MGDRTAVTAVIHACLEGKRAAVLEIIRNNGLTEEAPSVDQLVLGESYMGTEIYCGTSADVATAIIEAAPEAMFTVHEDPAYEWLGEVHYYAPDLGHWRNNCDSNGRPQFTADDIRAILEESDPRARARMTGEAWEQRFGAVREATYHGITKVECLICGYSTTSAAAMETWNDLGVTCLGAPGGHYRGVTRWSHVDGPDTVVVLENDTPTIYAKEAGS